jgi:exopolysaccharide biosynthesis polyprenyl glycosylphosphotransferase
MHDMHERRDPREVTVPAPQMMAGVEVTGEVTDVDVAGVDATTSGVTRITRIDLTGPSPAIDLTLVAPDCASQDTLSVYHQLAGAETPVRDYARRQQIQRVAPKWLRRYTALVVLGDLFVATLATLTANATGNQTLNNSIAKGHWMPVLFPVVWVMALALGRTYEHRFVGGGTDEYRRLLTSAIALLAAIATVSYARNYDIAHGTVTVALPMALLLSLLVHFIARQVLHQQRREGKCLQRVIVVGRERSVAELIRTVRREPHAGFAVVAACVDHARGDSIEGVPVLGDSDAILPALVTTGADTIAVTAWSEVSQTDLRRLSWDLEGSGVSLLVAPRLTDVSGPRIHIQPVAGLPLINVEEPEFTGVRRFAKAAFDRIGALLALVLLSPLLIGLALAVRLTSRGPVLFRQTRVGRHGKTFVMHKFRSMYVDAEARLTELREQNESDGLLFKMKDDPRVTPVGRWMRRLSLDELPQLIDVLVGRMSLVGPRPPLPSEVAQYPLDVRRRLIVKPGITGLWQVSGRSDLSWDESVRLDLYYVENWSLPLDLTILTKTVLAVVRGSGAY